MIFNQNNSLTLFFLCILLAGLPCRPTIHAQQSECVKTEWSKNYGGFEFDGANHLIQTNDGGYLAVGFARSSNMDLTENHGKQDYWIVKVDSLGEMEWQQSFGGSDNDRAADAVQTPDGGFLVVGGAVSFDVDVVGSHGQEDVWVLKLNATGGLVWSKTFGGSGNERGEAIEATSDGNYVIAGYSESSNGDVGQNKGDFDFWLFKITPTGNLLWENTFGGNQDDWGFDVKQMPDGGFLMAGSTISSSGDVGQNKGFYDYWLVKTDATGNMEWERSYGGTLEERAYKLIALNDGGAIVAGTSNSSDWDVNGPNGSYDCWLIRITPTGDIIWARNYGGQLEDRTFALTELAEGNFLMTGYSLSNNGDISQNYGSFDAWLVKFDPDGNIIWEKNLGGTNEDRMFAILERRFGGYAAAGYSASSDNDLPNNFGQRDLWIISLSPDTLSTFLGNDTTLCFNDALLLQADLDNVGYLWSDGSTESFFTVTSSGEYWLEVDDEGCRARDTILVDYFEETVVSLGNDTILCEGEVLQLHFDIPGADYRWRDGSTNDSFLVEIPGTYWVAVQKEGCEQRDTIEVEFTEIEIGFPEYAFICQGESLPIQLTHPQATYLWQDGSTSADYDIAGPGLYWVEVAVGGCSDRDSVQVDYQAGPDSIFAITAYLCEGEGVWFDAEFPGATYLWSDGSTDPRFKAVEEGEYSVEVTINGCVFKEEVELVACERCLYIPNIFTPNGDGINDLFRTFPTCSISNYKAMVFDRWGNVVFESTSLDNHWDGDKKGDKAAHGVYTYLIEYDVDNNGTVLPQRRVGTVTLIR